MNDATSLSLEPIEGESPLEDMEIGDKGDKDVEPAAVVEADAPVQVNWNQATKERRILFVDDDAKFLNLCHRRFEASEYSIFTASDADDAIRLLENQSIDVVISDMSMPGKNGAELMQDIEKKFPDIVRIIASGKFDLANTIEAINKGHIYKYVTKPFNEKDLKLTIYQALLEKERREAQERRRKERQENVKRRAKQLGEMVVRTRDKADKAYDESLSMLTGLVTMGSEAPLRVSELAARLAGAAGASEADCQQIKVAALLQDVASVGQPLVPVSEMGSAEKEIFFRHPVLSAKLVAEMTPFRKAAFMIKSHHERFDGKGFPCGLRGEEIPWGARVLALATAYEAARGQRNLSHYETMAALARVSERFDPDLLSALDGMESDDASIG